MFRIPSFFLQQSHLKAKTDKRLQKTQTQIEILQSYCQSLIREWVTGKKRVPLAPLRHPDGEVLERGQ